jgi:fatty acid synthase
VQVIVSTSDIATRDGCNKLITDAIKLGAVGGIFNLAVKLRDSLLENQDACSFTESLAPKAVATKHLDEISRTRCPLLQHFVVFSSVSCGRGNAGQCNYGMANSVMERIVEQRNKVGLAGKAIQWGAVGEVGIVADMQEDKLDMEIGGTLQQRISSCLEELDTLMTVPSSIVASMVVAEKRYTGGAKGGIIDMIMNIMSIKDTKTISMETKLSELGMDSLMTVEISQALEREFNLTVTPQELRSMTLLQLKAFESDGSMDSIEFKVPHGFAYLVRNIGEEPNSNQVIIKLESLMDEGYTKALIIPGIEGELLLLI